MPIHRVKIYPVPTPTGQQKFGAIPKGTAWGDQKGSTLCTSFILSPALILMGKLRRNLCSFPSASLQCADSWMFSNAGTSPAVSPGLQAGGGDTSALTSSPLFKKVVSSSQINLIGPVLCVLRYLGSSVLFCAAVSREDWNRPTIRHSRISLSTIHGVPAVAAISCL